MIWTGDIIMIWDDELMAAVLGGIWLQRRRGWFSNIII